MLGTSKCPIELSSDEDTPQEVKGEHVPASHQSSDAVPQEREKSAKRGSGEKDSKFHKSKRLKKDEVLEVPCNRAKCRQMLIDTGKYDTGSWYCDQACIDEMDSEDDEAVNTFTSYWCAVCRKKMPFLNTIQDSQDYHYCSKLCQKKNRPQVLKDLEERKKRRAQLYEIVSHLEQALKRNHKAAEDAEDAEEDEQEEADEVVEEEDDEEVVEEDD